MEQEAADCLASLMISWQWLLLADGNFGFVSLPAPFQGRAFQLGSDQESIYDLENAVWEDI
jgi:hypothetical protein